MHSLSASWRSSYRVGVDEVVAVKSANGLFESFLLAWKVLRMAWWGLGLISDDSNRSLNLCAVFGREFEFAEGDVEEAAGFGGELLAHGVDGSAGACVFAVLHEGLEERHADLFHEIPSAAFSDRVELAVELGCGFVEVP